MSIPTPAGMRGVVAPSGRCRAIGWVAALAALTGPASAQPADPWVGARVVARASDTKLKVGAKVTATLNAGSVFAVDRVRGEWLWVDAGNLAGWVKKADVVPLENAVAYFTAVIGGDPGSDHAYVSRGIVWQTARDYDRAVADDTEAIRINPGSPWAYHDRAAAYFAKGDFTRALADAEEAVRLDPGEPSHRANRASVAFARKEYDRAIGDYTEALRLLRGNEATLDDAAEAGAPGRTRGRLWAAKWACARADCWAARNAPDRAVADHSEAVRLDPRDAATINSMAWLLATCGDSRVRDGLRAFGLAATACELTGYRDHLYLDTLAAAYAEAGDFVAAVRWQSKALELAAADERFAGGYRARMKLFREKTPFREEATR